MATGLIDYGIVRPELAGAFGAGVRAQQDERMQNQLAQQKLAMGQMQQEQAGLQLQDFKRRQSALDQLVSKAQQSGRTGTPKEYAQQLYDYAIAAREPKLMIDAQQVLLAAKEREDYDADLANRRGSAPTGAPTGTPMMSRPTGQAGLGMGEAERIAQEQQGLAEQDARYAQMEREGEANRQDATYRLATGGDPVAEAQYRLATGYEPSNVPAPAFGGAPALRRPSGQAELAAMEDAERAKQRVNALAPAPAPSVNALAPSVNAMAPDAATVLQNKIIDLQTRFPNSSKPEVALLTKRLEAMLKESPDLINMERLGYPLTQQGYKLYREAQRTERLLTPEEEAQKVRIGLASRPPAQPRPEPAPRTQQVTMSDGTLGIMNMDTGAITPANLGGAPVKGKPSAFAEKTAAQKAQMGKDLNFAITQLGDITKDGGLIDQSTGSGAGRLVDIGAGFVGQATKGAIAIGKIAPIADLVLKMIPRFEGPQSNKDTQSYKEAAGQLADPTLPTAIRKEAGKTVLRLMKERQGQFVSSDMAAENVAPAAGGGVVDFGSLK